MWCGWCHPNHAIFYSLTQHGVFSDSHLSFYQFDTKIATARWDYFSAPEPKTDFKLRPPLRSDVTQMFFSRIFSHGETPCKLGKIKLRSAGNFLTEKSQNTLVLSSPTSSFFRFCFSNFKISPVFISLALPQGLSKQERFSDKVKKPNWFY